MAAGVTRLIAVGVDLDRSATAVSLAHAYEEVWAGVGHHPLEASEPNPVTMRDLARDEMVVVIGEIGLDFEHVGGPHRDLQIERLKQMFSIATDLGLPVSIHNRGAASEVLANARPYRDNAFKVEMTKRAIVRALSIAGGLEWAA